LEKIAGSFFGPWW